MIIYTLTRPVIGVRGVLIGIVWGDVLIWLAMVFIVGGCNCIVAGCCNWMVAGVSIIPIGLDSTVSIVCVTIVSAHGFLHSMTFRSTHSFFGHSIFFLAGGRISPHASAISLLLWYAAISIAYNINDIINNKNDTIIKIHIHAGV